MRMSSAHRPSDLEHGSALDRSFGIYGRPWTRIMGERGSDSSSGRQDSEFCPEAVCTHGTADWSRRNSWALRTDVGALVAGEDGYPLIRRLIPRIRHLGCVHIDSVVCLHRQQSCACSIRPNDSRDCTGAGYKSLRSTLSQTRDTA